MNHKHLYQPSRRGFLTQAVAGVLSFPTIVPASVFGQKAPSRKISLGIIGYGMMGPDNTRRFLQHSDCQIVAACDVDQKHLDLAVSDVNTHYGKQACRRYTDYRELLASREVDAVMLAIPDHWHALVATEAANQKKDIYGEKPLALTVREQEAIVRSVQKNEVIWQTGSWQRSDTSFRIAAEIVANGLIGKVQRVEIGLPSGHKDFAQTADQRQVVPVPAELDYDRWLGPSAFSEYIPARVHRNWRWHYSTGGGQILDWIGHHGDIALWALGMDRVQPLKVCTLQADLPPVTDLWNTATRFKSEVTYPGDITFTIAGGHDDIRPGVRWIGSDGWVWVDRGGQFDCSKAELRVPVKRREGKQVINAAKAPVLGDDVIRRPLYRSQNHYRNFLDSIATRQPTITPVETAHNSTLQGHLMLISHRVGRNVEWDAARADITNDPEASRLLSRPYRQPWVFPG
jgi:predicted dehydrogenase